MLHVFYTQEGYREREDRIAELEEFINDQVVELDKMEAAMKQTVANKQAVEENLRDVTKSKSITEKQFEKVKKFYEQAKVSYTYTLMFQTFKMVQYCIKYYGINNYHGIYVTQTNTFTYPVKYSSKSC